MREQTVDGWSGAALPADNAAIPAAYPAQRAAGTSRPGGGPRSPAWHRAAGASRRRLPDLVVPAGMRA